MPDRANTDSTVRVSGEVDAGEVDPVAATALEAVADLPEVGPLLAGAAAGLPAGLTGIFFSGFFADAVDLEPADFPALSPPVANENDNCLPSVDAISVIV
ncbi:MAG: hypothetical protein KA354_17380 [Phycisphaerae bacterium]|nr:hypothetical protein [Phycisphaerae bacterium]